MPVRRIRLGNFSLWYTDMRLQKTAILRDQARDQNKGEIFSEFREKFLPIFHPCLNNLYI